MARSGRHRFTPKKKKNQPQDKSFEIPSDCNLSAAEWAALTSVPCCIVKSRGEKDSLATFKVGEIVLVLGYGMEPDKPHDLHTYWVGKIEKMKGLSPTADVWVKMRWFYSGEDIEANNAAVGAPSLSFNVRPVGMEDRPSTDIKKVTDCYGRFERSLSQHSQWVHFHTLSGHIRMAEYDERSCEQGLIDSREDFYTRRTYDAVRGQVNPPIESSVTCTCREPYNPDNPDVMHFCPRPRCRKWFHAVCLGELGSMKDPKCSPDEHRYYLLCASPDHDEVPHLPQSRSQERGTSSTRSTGTPSDMSGVSGLDDLHPVLVACAHRQIVKGGAATHGVAGNVKLVLEARRWIYKLCLSSEDDCHTLKEVWMAGLNEWLDPLIVENQLVTDRPDCYTAFECPSCHGAI